VRHGFSQHNKGFLERNNTATNTSLIGLDAETKKTINNLLTEVDKFNNSDEINQSNKIDQNIDDDISLDGFTKLSIYTKLIDSELITQDKIKEAFEETIKPNNNDDDDDDDNDDNVTNSGDGDGDNKNNKWKIYNPHTIKKSDIGVFLENILNKIYIKKNGELQSILAGRAFSKILADNTIKAVFVSDLVRTQETAGFFLSQLTDIQLNPFPPIIVLPCLHELANGEKDGERKTYEAMFKKGFSQVSKIGTLGTTAGVMNRENNTNCRATKEEEYVPGSWDLNQFERKDCSTINIKGNPIDIDWELYKIFYKGYRDENKWGREECIDNHFLGIFFDNYVLPENLIRIEEVVATRIDGGKKRRQTKKQRNMKSKKVRRAKKSNKKSKKVKRRSNKRKA
jgi:hypothetical protein